MRNKQLNHIKATATTVVYQNCVRTCFTCFQSQIYIYISLSLSLFCFVCFGWHDIIRHGTCRLLTPYNCSLLVLPATNRYTRAFLMHFFQHWHTWKLKHATSCPLGSCLTTGTQRAHKRCNVKGAQMQRVICPAQGKNPLLWAIHGIYSDILSFYHRFFSAICSDILFDILSGIQSVISSGILSGIYSDVLSGILFWHVWHSIRHSVWHSISQEEGEEEEEEEPHLCWNPGPSYGRWGTNP